MIIGNMNELYPDNTSYNYNFSHKGSHRKTSRPKSLNFEAYAAEGNHFINQVAFELDTNRQAAARITRAVLHAVRDRLPANDAIQFAQGLPMALKAIFIDQYDLSKVPVVIRSPRRFMDFIYEKAGLTARIDFPDDYAIIEGLQAVFYVLEQSMDFGQVHQIKHALNQEITHLIDNYKR
jgi:uncharacterized protein (DUF2267 family)